MEHKLPIGIQSFEKLRTDNFLYVDKTEYIYKLAHNNIPYFLSRPRRFGKSLLLSTFKAYWEGKKSLFDGLAVEKLEESNEDAWKEYPVFYIDFNGNNYNDNKIEDILEGMLLNWESLYGKTESRFTLGDRFEQLIMKAEEKTGRRAVILVDEYDKALLETLDNPELQEHIKRVFKGFFGVLKKADEHIQFVFISGVSKFHKVSIFSDLNMLKDISLNNEYSCICGITDEEIDKYFMDEVLKFASLRNISFEECRNQLKHYYDGYHFYPDSKGVYNPFSLLNALNDCSFEAYWFSTGSPSFLVRYLRNSSFDVRKFSSGNLYASEARLKDYSGDNSDIVPLLYQTGYLTITDYEKNRRRYTLGFPNEEVRYGFLESLLPVYTPHAIEGNGLDIFTLDEHLENGDLDKIRDVFIGLFADITYTTNDAVFEHYFQTVIYLVFTLLGKFVQCERHTFEGRIDCILQTKDYIYIFEFKRDDTVDAALAQIEENEYALPFVADSRKLYKIGVSFDSEKRKLIDWKVV